MSYLTLVSRTVMLSFARYSYLIVPIYLAVIISCPVCTRSTSLLGFCYRVDHARIRCVGIAYNHYGGHNRETNKNISNAT